MLTYPLIFYLSMRQDRRRLQVSPLLLKHGVFLHNVSFAALIQLARGSWHCGRCESLSSYKSQLTWKSGACEQV